MKCVGSFFVFILFIQNVICDARIDPLVDTNLGLIRGLRASDGPYAMFMGIPYAVVNDTNPFGDAIPYPPFEDIFEAYDDSAMCPQTFGNRVMGNLDCLRLNVYVPTSATTRNRLPVMVYIHGGGFSHGLGGRITLSPRFLMPHDVIVVTINYRLGVYGFMCVDTPEASGNQGLKDQLIALKWIKNNIQSFGGDADKITLFGESAGGHSIDFHLLSPKETLFNKVILQSGSSLAATVLYEPDKSAAITIAKILGFETSDTNEALSYLAKSDTNLVMAAASESAIIFKPCEEKEFDGVEPFITSHWVTDSKVPKVKNMPVMLGFSEHEMALAHFNRDHEYYESFDLVTEYLNRTFTFNDQEFIEMRNLVKHYYFGEEEMSENVKWGMIYFDSDFTYIQPIQRTIKKYLDSDAGPIYYYMFSYIGGRNFISTEDEHEPTATACCASHSDLMPYLFDTQLRPELTDPTDQEVMEKITAMWTNFAKYSDPTPETSELLPVKWTPLTRERYYYMRIDAELSVRSRPHSKRMAFWNIFYDYNKKLQRWYTEE